MRIMNPKSDGLGDRADRKPDEQSQQSLMPFGRVGNHDTAPAARRDGRFLGNGFNRHGSAFFQARSHEILDSRRGAKHRLGGTHRVVRLQLFETKRHERQNSVVDSLIVG